MKFKKDLVHRVKCSGDGNNRKAKFVKHPLGRDVFRFALTMKKLDIHPFLLEEVTVIITTGTADRRTRSAISGLVTSRRTRLAKPTRAFARSQIRSETQLRSARGASDLASQDNGRRV